MLVEWRDITTISPSPRNARRHSDKQITLLADSIRQWGWTFPVLIDSQNRLISGEGRWKAAKKLGEKTIPCLVAENWTNAQIDAYRIADNQLALNSSWDYDLVLEQLKTLQSAEFNLELLGFDENFLAGMLAQEPETDRLEEWNAASMPEMTMDGEEDSYHRVIVHFKNDSDIADFAKLLGQTVNARTKSVWYPELRNTNYKTQAWKEAEIE